MHTQKKIYIAGHNGLLGSAILKKFKSMNYKNIITENKNNLNLLDFQTLNQFFLKEKPNYVILAAGFTGGIEQNKNKPFNLMFDNLSIQLNMFRACHEHIVEKMIFFGSSCMYPMNIDGSMNEAILLTGKMEPTSLSYALAKLTGIQMSNSLNEQFNAKKFLSIIPNSIYGPNDNFNPQTGHVLASLINKFYHAKLNKDPYVLLWGDGTPKREFVYVDDVAEVCNLLLRSDVSNQNFPMNVGTGVEISILNLATIISNFFNYRGIIKWDNSKPNGVHRKLLDSSRIRSLGWKPKVNLEDGIKKTIEWYISKK